MVLEHYSPIKGLNVLDPKHMGSGCKGMEYKSGIPEIKRIYFYEFDSRPEPLIKQEAKSIYYVTLDTRKIMDLGTKQCDKFKEQMLQENKQAWNTDKLLKLLIQEGFFGFKNSSSCLPYVVGVFVKTEPYAERELK